MRAKVSEAGDKLEKGACRSGGVPEWDSDISILEIDSLPMPFSFVFPAFIARLPCTYLLISPRASRAALST